MTDKICTFLAQGKTIAEISRMEGMPSEDAMAEWTWKYPEFYNAFDKAREFGAHAMNYKLLERIEKANCDKDELTKLKIIVDQYRWFIGKINQRKYGDNMTIKGDADNPLTLNIATALDARIAAARAAPVIEHDLAQALPVIDVE